MVLRLVVLAVIATITVARVPDYFNDHPTFHINEEIDDDSELVFLQAVWRHGDRMPTSGFKIDEKKWDYPWGQLTPVSSTIQIKQGSITIIFGNVILERNGTTRYSRWKTPSKIH